MTDNYIEFFYNLFYRLIDFSKYAYEFLFKDIEFLNMKINIFGMLIGGGFITFWLVRLIKSFNPLT